MAEKEYIDLETAYDMDTLEDWYINSVSDNDTPVWTEEHLEELLNDFYVIPKDTSKADVAPVKHGHWVKEKSDVLTDTDKWIEQISNMVFDVNPAEIASHIQNGTLKEWCLRWQQEMNMLIITAPLDYSNSKEREENA